MGVHRNCTGGMVGYVDRLVLGENHIFTWGIDRRVYDSQVFDPENLLGCILTCVHVFFGVQCGVTLLVHKDWKSRTIRLLMWCFVFGLLAGILTGFQIEDGPIPISKNMWSLSYVLITSAISLAVFTLTYLLIDVQQWWSGNPFRWAGMNSILMYFGHEIIQQMFPFRWRFGLMNTHFMLLLENSWHSGMWMVLAWYLHRKRLYLKV